MDRRFFLHVSALAAASALAGWSCAPRRAPAPAQADGAYDAVVIGAGLGGLTAAGFLARSGHKTLLLEQYDIPGGYATSFARAAGNREFTCEVSLHATVLQSANVRTMLTDLGVWDGLRPVEHAHSWVSRFPGFGLEVPTRVGLDGFERQLFRLFPAQREALAAYFGLWRGVMADTARLGKGLDPGQRAQFPTLFPHLWQIRGKTVAQLLEEARVSDPRLKAVLTQSCGYYGLPPSRLGAFYYLQPTGEYLELGGCYLKGTSQALSDALAKAVTDAGGSIVYGARAAQVLVEDGRAAGVRTTDGKVHRARAVVCNASAPQLFGSMLPQDVLPADYRQRLDSFSNSPGSFIVWLGLDRDVRKQLPHSEASFYASTDMEANYAAAMACDFERSGFSLMVYDNLVEGFSPPGCSSLCMVSLCAHEHWKPFQADYLAGRKDAYNAEKKRLTEVMIAMAEKRALPGLRTMIVMRDSATPLTNLRFTLNTGGAIYGYNQSVDNTFMTRLDNRTPVKGLYLASAWGNPGGGFGGALLGGKGAFKAVAEDLAGGKA